MGQREIFQDKPVYALSEITKSIEKMIETNYKRAYYIKAEILKLNHYPHSGHCYPELVEKESGKIKAQLRGVIWSNQYRYINERFIDITGEPLKEDIAVLCLATIEFSGQYGLNLQIQDIEPLYTLGEMARNKIEVIERLKKEHIYLLNKQKILPILPKRLAIISVETSKGYNDFIVTLQQNKLQYYFETTLFPSILQGDKALISIPGRLSEVGMRKHEFDCVLILRGGGGDAGMSCYDQYELAAAVANFPIPVITGIGHSTNETVTDMVAFANKITPTEVAYFLIERFTAFSRQLDEYQDTIVRSVHVFLQDKQFFFSKIHQQLPRIIEKFNYRKQTELSATVHLVLQNVSQYFVKQHNTLQQFQTKINLLHPNNILKRGFTLTLKNGKILRSPEEVNSGDIILSKFIAGEIRSIVK